MNIFETVKAGVSPSRAAEQYGLTVSRSGMTRCPFHDDRHPSMKFYDDHFHCFGCQTGGDVIDLTAKLFGITNREAAQKLTADFGIQTIGNGAAASCRITHPHIRQFREDEMQCLQTLMDYLHLLEDWMVRYAPKTPDEPHDDRFVEACQMRCRIEYMADVLTVGSLGDRTALVNELMKDSKIADLKAYTARKKAEGVCHG